MQMKILLAGMLLAMAPAVAGAQSTSYFRSDYGVSDGGGRLPEQIEEPNCLVWRTALDSGHSTPCVVGDRVFVTTFDGKQLATVALGMADGHVLWKQVAPAKRLEVYHPTGSPAVSTPASDGRRVFVFFGSYGLLCYDLDGKLLWSQPLGPFQDEFGSASSPILADGKLFINEDHDIDSFLMAVDTDSGRILWKTPRDGFTRSYSTPVVWNPGGGRQLVVAGALELAGYDLDSGRQLWRMEGLARIVNPTPIVDGQRLFVATWSPGGDTDARIAMEPWSLALEQWDADHNRKLTRTEVSNKDVLDRFYRIDLNQDQSLDQPEWTKYAQVFERAQNSLVALGPGPAGGAPKVLWRYNKGLPYVTSPLEYRGILYLLKDGGIVSSLDSASGKLIKQGRARGAGGYYASPVAGDGKVYLVSEAGVISVLQAAGRWQVLASRDLAERTMATPVIDGPRLLVRTEKALYCFQAPAGAATAAR
jgi:outer membrane protein assembly factor BamB